MLLRVQETYQAVFQQGEQMIQRMAQQAKLPLDTEAMAFLKPRAPFAFFVELASLALDGRMQDFELWHA